MSKTSDKRNAQGIPQPNGRTWFVSGRRGSNSRRLACVVVLPLALVALLSSAIASAAGDRRQPATSARPSLTRLPSGFSPLIASGSKRLADADSIIGDWSVSYNGTPAVVTMSLSGGVYSVTADTPVRVSSCFLPPGTLLATFSGSGGSYSGQHGLWYVSDCSFGYWDPMTCTLDGSTPPVLTCVLAGGYGTVLFTKIIGEVDALAFNGLTRRSITLVVAVFSDFAGEAPQDYTAQIDWGDGSPPGLGIVAPYSGGAPCSVYEPLAGTCFQVLGTHSYTTSGARRTVVTVSGGGRSVQDSGVADIRKRPGGLPNHAIGLLTFTITKPDGSSYIEGCTATVVNSPAGDVIVGARHCFVGDVFHLGDGERDNFEFAPAHQGPCPQYDQVASCNNASLGESNPFGVWQGRTADLVYDQNPADDVAYLIVHPDGVSSIRPVESAVGGVPQFFDRGPYQDYRDFPVEDWRIYGYPIDTVNAANHLKLLHCKGSSLQLSDSAPLLSAQCDFHSPFFGGSGSQPVTGISGGPWVNNENGYLGEVAIAAVQGGYFPNAAEGPVATGTALGVQAELLFKKGVAHG
jgi:hypothetical protein